MSLKAMQTREAQSILDAHMCTAYDPIHSKYCVRKREQEPKEVICLNCNKSVISR